MPRDEWLTQMPLAPATQKFWAATREPQARFVAGSGETVVGGDRIRRAQQKQPTWKGIQLWLFD